MIGEHTVRGSITIDPPISGDELHDWSELDKRGNFVLQTTEQPTTVGVAITGCPRESRRWYADGETTDQYLTECLQEIADRFAKGRTFAGYLEYCWSPGEAIWEVWRLTVRDGRVVRINPSWAADVAEPVMIVDLPTGGDGESPDCFLRCPICGQRVSVSHGDTLSMLNERGRYHHNMIGHQHDGVPV